jgi:hypothetical protein
MSTHVRDEISQQYQTSNVDRNSSVGIATRYGLAGTGIEFRWMGAWSWPPTPSSAEVKERVELYPYSPSGPSWPLLRLSFTFTFTFTKKQYHALYILIFTFLNMGWNDEGFWKEDRSKHCRWKYWGSALSPPDFDLFSKLKKPLRGKRFRSIEEVSNEVIWVIRRIKNEGVHTGIKDLPKRWTTVIKHNGDYIEGL